MRFLFECSLYLSKKHWKYNAKNVGGTFLKVFGVPWLIVEPCAYFVTPIADLTRGNWGLFLAYAGVALLWAVIKCKPKSLVEHRLKGRDVSIEIRITNIFCVEGAFVISTNSTFDTSISKGLISPHSLQGQFTKRYYYNAESHHYNEEQINSDINESLAGQKPIGLLTDGRKGKTERYEIGTVAQVRPKNKLVYLLAIAHMNKHGNAESSFEEVIEGLGKLWNYIAGRGDLVPLVVPALGTGRARITAPREEMIREIINSFVTACSESRFAPKLTIVISPGDYREYNIDLLELGDYLWHVCQYTDLKSKTDTGKGEAIP